MSFSRYIHFLSILNKAGKIKYCKHYFIGLGLLSRAVLEAIACIILYMHGPVPGSK